MTDLHNMKESKRFPGLFVLKYKNKVFYDNLWNDDLVEMRGRVVDAEGKTVINPFTKIFNRFENKTDIDRDQKCLAVCKVNGFMAAITYVDSVGDAVVSTTGSLDSDFAVLAEQYLGRLKTRVAEIARLQRRNTTYLFEIVDPSDPHIIKENAGAYLLGARFVDDKKPYTSTVINETYLDEIAKMWDLKRPQWCVASFGEVVNLARTCNHEGYVVYELDKPKPKSLKIKSPYYLTTKFLARINPEKLLDKLKNKAELRKTIDEEFYALIDFVDDYKDVFAAINEQERIVFIENFLRSEVKGVL